MLGFDKDVDREQVDLLWRLLQRLDGHEVTKLAGSPELSPQERVDRLHGALVAAGSVQSLPSAGSWLTRKLVEQVTSGGLDAGRTVLAGTGVLALTRVADVTDPRRAHRVLVAALLDAQVPADWEPPEAPEAAGGRSRLKKADDARRTMDALADLAPEAAKLWQKALGQLPVVGLVGSVLGNERSLGLVLGRACAELDLPQPTGSPIREHLRAGARQVGHGVAAVGQGFAGLVRKARHRGDDAVGHGS